MYDIQSYLEDDDPNWDEMDIGIAYEIEGEVVEDVEAKRLPKHSDGSNVALWGTQTLCWTEDLGANVINLYGYLGSHWNEDGPREIELNDGRTFIPEWDTAEVSLRMSLEATVKAAKARADEGNVHFGYVLAGWINQAELRTHIADESARKLRRYLKKLKDHPDIDLPDDINTDDYRGGVDRL